MNVRIYLITDAIFSIVDTRLRLPAATLFKGMQAGRQLELTKWLGQAITNGWDRLATQCGWASPLFPGLRKQHLINLRPL